MSQPMSVQLCTTALAPCSAKINKRWASRMLLLSSMSFSECVNLLFFFFQSVLSFIPSGPIVKVCKNLAIYVHAQTYVYAQRGQRRTLSVLRHHPLPPLPESDFSLSLKLGWWPSNPNTPLVCRPNCTVGAGIGRPVWSCLAFYMNAWI